jgi:hypothetical protein
MMLVAALAGTETSEAIPILEKIRHLDIDGRVKRNAMVMADALATVGGTSESVKNLKAALEKLEEEQKKLRGALEERKLPI